MKRAKPHQIKFYVNDHGKNINQIVSKANSMSTVFENDLLEIKSLMKQLLDSEKQLLKFFIDVT